MKKFLSEPGFIIPAVILAFIFGLGPFLWVLGAWHCMWLPAAGICQ